MASQQPVSTLSRSVGQSAHFKLCAVIGKTNKEISFVGPQQSCCSAGMMQPRCGTGVAAIQSAVVLIEAANDGEAGRQGREGEERRGREAGEP
eukprot:superscaffoldBa00001123_g9074